MNFLNGELNIILTLSEVGEIGEHSSFFNVDENVLYIGLSEHCVAMSG